MSERTFTLEIVTPDRVVMSDDKVVSLVVPGVEGYFGVMAGHAPLISEITIGEITVRHADGSTVHIACAHGFIEVSENKASVLSYAAERAEEIDVERAREAARRAEERLAEAGGEGEVDHARAEAALKRALNRLRVAEKSI